MNFKFILEEINDIKLRKRNLFEEFQDDLLDNYKLLQEYNYLIGCDKEFFMTVIDRYRFSCYIGSVSKNVFLEYMFLLFRTKVDPDNVTGLSILMNIYEIERTFIRIDKDIKELKQIIFKTFS